MSHSSSSPDYNYKAVMVNFIYQLDWAMGYTDIWFNIMLGMSVEVFLDEIDINKADCLPQSGWSTFNLLET